MAPNSCSSVGSMLTGKNVDVTGKKNDNFFEELKRR